MGVLFMLVLKRVLAVLDWLGNRRYLARLRANRRQAHRRMRSAA